MAATNRIFLRTTAATIGVLLIVGLSACAVPRAQTTDQRPATRVPTPTPSTAVTSESAQREAMVDKCFANPSCRLEVTGEELERSVSRFGWQSLSTVEMDDSTYFSWMSPSKQGLLIWHEQEGVVFVDFIVSGATESASGVLRHVLSAALPDWERDHAADVLSIWYNYEVNPAYRGARPSGRVGDTIMEMYYIERLPAVGVRVLPEEIKQRP